MGLQKDCFSAVDCAWIVGFEFWQMFIPQSLHAFVPDSTFICAYHKSYIELIQFKEGAHVVIIHYSYLLSFYKQAPFA